MLLTELNPRWINYNGSKLGITFDCPHCKAVRLGVAFHHLGNEQMDDSCILATSPNEKIWTETNPAPDTFDNITLTPSIDCSAAGHWHGFITNGIVS